MQIDVEVKKYFCKAGVKGMQVGDVRGLLQGLREEEARLGKCGGTRGLFWGDFGLLALLALATWRPAGDS